MLLLYVAALILGVTFGSFFNVVIWRFPRGESVAHPPSACPRCGSPVEARDNIPVISWLLLRGRCRSCGEPISARYPLVELLTGVLWLAAAVRFGLSPQTVLCIVLFSLLVILSFIDLDTMRLPNPLVAVLALAGLVGATISQLFGMQVGPLLPLPPWMPSPLGAAVVGALASAGIALALAVAYAAARKKSGFGMGDVKLLGAIGLYLALYGVFVLFVGALLGTVYSLWATTRDRTFAARPFPFGPFLSIAAVLVVLWGPWAMDAYLALLGL